MFGVIHNIEKKRRKFAFVKGLMVGAVCAYGLFTINNQLMKRKAEKETKQIEENNED